jgi:hypothetical protein
MRGGAVSAIRLVKYPGSRLFVRFDLDQGDPGTLGQHWECTLAISIKAAETL